MPALDALRDRLRASHTLACGASVDSVYSHAAWAAALGGIRMPLLADFHPKGAVATSFGMFLAPAGITDRATVLIDAAGVVRHASSVTPAGKRDMDALVKLCEELDAGWSEPLPAFEDAPGLPAGSELFVKDRCMFSRWSSYVRTNLGLEASLPMTNVTSDPAAGERLAAAGGKNQAPALLHDGTVLYESKDINAFLVERAADRW
ncbi:MAG: redoxin domain-containing protein [Alphaproteobacteria bacterium]|nr:redoxin domain-containing protein [Alphaproteobacteria bacterium]MCB9697077.1 redoxin domain-containing protein [Alphaproteobacteria bacterium]